MAITLNGSTGITSAGNITAATNITASGNITAAYLIGNGSQISGVTASANTGNIGFTGDAIYDLNGIIIENADLSHGATAAIILPANGNTSPIQVNNTYGNIVLQAGTSSDITASWTFNNSGNLTLPTNSSSINYANGQPYGGGASGNTFSAITMSSTPSGPSDQIKYGTGNLVSWLDGGWVIGEYNGTDYGTEGVRISPGIEGNVEVNLPSNQTANVNALQLSNYVGNVVVTTGFNTGNSSGTYQWMFNNAGSLDIPTESNSFGTGRIQSANGYPTLLAYGSAEEHGGPELDWMNTNDPANAFGNSTVLRNTMYINDNGLYIGMNENGVANVASPHWRFAPSGSTIFPVLSTQRGDNPSGTISGQTLLFGDATQEAVISTPDGNATDGINSQRLVINPGQGYNSGEGGDIYLWAGRGGNGSGSGGDIKIRGGQGGANTSGGSGGAGGYIRIEAGDAASTGVAGYIDVTGGSGGVGQGGGYVHITGGNGDTVGGEAKIYGGYGQATGGNVDIWGGGSGAGQANEGKVNIQTGGYTWTYDASGNLTLPQTGVIYETNIPSGGLSGKTIALKPYGGTSLDQQLLVYPTAGADANHLHLTTGNLWNTELFLGNDNLYVKLANTGNIVINSNDDVGNTAQWTFGTAGTILNSGNLTLQTPSGTPNSVYNWVGQGGWNQGSYTDLATTGGTGTGLTVDVAAGGGGYISINQISIHTPGTGYTAGDVITINNENDLPGTFEITVSESGWTFDTAGNLTVAGSIIMPPNSVITGALASPAPSINGFTSISGQSLTTVSGRINSGTTIVDDDGINSIALAPGAQMDVFGFPFGSAGIRGQLTISGITSTTQANGTWYYESTSDIAYQLYTDATYSTLVDATGWTAYTGGGSVAITKHSTASNVVIDSNGYFSTFDNTGNVTLPGNVSVAGGTINLTGEGLIRSNNDTVTIESYDTAEDIGYGFYVGTTGGMYFKQGLDPNWLTIIPSSGYADITTTQTLRLTAGTGTAGGAGKNLTITAGAADQTDFYATPGGNVNITGGLGAFNDGGGGGQGGFVNITSGTSSDPAGVPGNVTINTGISTTWNFDYTGKMSVPGPIQMAVYANATVRDAAISSPTPGMMIYVTGTGMQVRGATSWNTVAGTGT